MNRIAFFLAAAVALALPIARADVTVPIAPVIDDIPAGDYALDRVHSSITLRITHLYVSSYTAHFARFDAHLRLDPAHPDRAGIVTTIDPKSLTLDIAPPGFRDLLLGPLVLDVDKFPTVVFRSTRVVSTGAASARVTGDFTLHGVTKPIVLTVTFDGGTRALPPEHRARVHFTGHARFKRSAFGLGYGSKLIVGDTADVVIDAQFLCATQQK